MSRTYAAALLRRIMPSLPDRVGALDIGTGDRSFLAELLAAGFTQVSRCGTVLLPIAAAEPAIDPLIRQAFFVMPRIFRQTASAWSRVFQTIEHVPDPLEICRGAFRLLQRKEKRAVSY